MCVCVFLLSFFFKPRCSFRFYHLFKILLEYPTILILILIPNPNPNLNPNPEHNPNPSPEPNPNPNPNKNGRVF